MAKTRKKQQSSPLHQILIAFTLLAIIVGLAFAKAAYNSNNEHNMFMSLQKDMKELQYEFNQVDTGWKYNEGCRGRGGDFDNDVPSSCAVSISNDNVDFSLNQERKMKTYSVITENSDSFQETEVTRPTSLGTYYTGFSFSKSDKIKCGMNTYHDETTNSSSDSRIFITLGCSGKTTKFYFPRSDL